MCTHLISKHCTESKLESDSDGSIIQLLPSSVIYSNESVSLEYLPGSIYKFQCSFLISWLSVDLFLISWFSVYLLVKECLMPMG